MMIGIETLLAWGATYKKVSANELIFREGTECYFYHQLVSGSVTLMNVNDEGGEFIQNMVEAGDSFGEFPLFDDRRYAVSAITNKDSVIIRIQKATFRHILEEYPVLHFAFSRLLTERLRFKFLLLKEISCFGPEHRISTLFAYFKEAKKNICHKCNRVELTRQQIADMTGLRVETVIRSIRHLKDKGALTIDKGKVYC
ncbi:MAG: Crp/Fnr family transcriptional regulator [Flavitalea sp.]